MTNPLLSATLIWDGGDTVTIPQQLMPRDYNTITACGQNQGTALERLAEVAGRVCYDSYGKGRDSAGFHKHILEVGHLSVLEHCVFTVAVRAGVDAAFLLRALSDCVNRPSLFVRLDADLLLITANLRHVLEWRRPGSSASTELADILQEHAHTLAPAIVPEPQSHVRHLYHTLVSEDNPNEAWITLLLTGSRGFSHELVRHGDWTAISQRSTRYVDEAESMWVVHPLLANFIRADDKAQTAPNGEATELTLWQHARHVIDTSQRAYRRVVEKLEPWLVSRGVDKGTARKQARGAARGYLGNALYTEVVFSASVAQWIHMLKMRASAPADAEIREVFCHALPELKMSRYGKWFERFELAPCPDGIGQIVVDV